NAALPMFDTVPLTCTCSPLRLTSRTSTRRRCPVAIGVSAGTASPPAKRSRNEATVWRTPSGRLLRSILGSCNGADVGAFGSGAKRRISTAELTPPPRVLMIISASATRIPAIQAGSFERSSRIEHYLLGQGFRELYNRVASGYILQASGCS